MNETALQIQNNALPVVARDFSPDQIALIKSTVAVGATDLELQLFLYTAKKRNLDPLARQIYFIKRWNESQKKEVGTIQVGIDGFRTIAEQSMKYAGNDDPIFETDSKGNPIKATATVWKIVANSRVAFTASARWSEYVPNEKQAFMWRKMPFTMLGKVAEALALRKAFPQDLSGMYIPEEMDQAIEKDIPSPKKDKQPAAPSKPTGKKETPFQRLAKAKEWFKKQNAEGFIAELIQQLEIDPIKINEIDQATSDKLFKALADAKSAIEKSKKNPPAPAQPNEAPALAPTPKAEAIDPVKEPQKLIANQTAFANYIAEARKSIQGFDKFVESKFGTGAKVATLNNIQKDILIKLIEQQKIK